MAGWPTFRTVKRHPLFESAAAAIQPDAKRFDEQLRGVEWAIATNPHRFPEISRTVLRLAKTDEWPGAPRLRIYFSVDNENLCTLRWVEVIEGPSTEEDESG